MNHTVISKSGWQGDHWRVRKTFSSKAKAQQFAGSIKTSDVKCNGYRVSIKSHRKPIARLIGSDDMVHFSDGTRAAL